LVVDADSFPLSKRLNLCGKTDSALYLKDKSINSRLRFPWCKVSVVDFDSIIKAVNNCDERRTAQVTISALWLDLPTAVHTGLGFDVHQILTSSMPSTAVHVAYVASAALSRE